MTDFRNEFDPKLVEAVKSAMGRKKLNPMGKTTVDLKPMLKERLPKRDEAPTNEETISELSSEKSQKYAKKAMADGLKRRMDSVDAGKVGDPTTEKKIRKRLKYSARAFADAYKKFDEEEQIDELSGKTLGSYIQKSRKENANKLAHSHELDSHPDVKKWHTRRSTPVHKLSDFKAAEEQKKKLDPNYPDSATPKRYKGIEKALEKLKSGKLTELTKEERIEERNDPNGFRGRARQERWVYLKHQSVQPSKYFMDKNKAAWRAQESPEEKEREKKGLKEQTLTEAHMPSVNWFDAHESGKLSHEDEVNGFQKLVDSQGWKHLQGHYGRMCHALIDAGHVRDTHGDFTGVKHSEE